MRFETTVPLYILITGITSYLVATYNKENLDYEKNEKKYFDRILLIFIYHYKKREIKKIEMLYRDIYNNDTREYIPPYIYYLVKTDEKEKLGKILLVDYLNYYPSQKKRVRNTINTIVNIGHFIVYSVYLFLLLALIFFMLMGLFVIMAKLIPIEGISLVGFENTNIIILILSILLYLFLLALLIYIIKLLGRDLYRDDVYTYDKKYINNLIKTKLKQYKKYTKDTILIEKI